MCDITSISAFIFYTQVSYSQDMRSQRQAVRIALKEIESLSFNMEVTGNLRNLVEDLQSLHRKYSACVQRDQGLVLRPKTTSSAERALQLKRKYKRLSQQISLYKSLPTKQGGRPRLDACYRNRVGKKAANKRKVQDDTFIHQYTGIFTQSYNRN